MKKIRKSSQNDNKIKTLMEKIKARNLSDEIETRELKIKESNKKLQKIKINSIKEMIYSNKKIPDSWKSKLNYQTQVLEIFAKDKNFLLYVGHITPEKTESNRTRPKTAKNKIINRNMFKSMSSVSKTPTDNFKDGNYHDYSLTTTKNYSSINIKAKLKKQKNKSLNEKDLNYILEQLQNEFPIKDKLIELFPEKLLKSIDIKNKAINNRNNNNNYINNYISNYKYPTIKPEKRRNIFRQNIFVNLISSKSNSINNKPRRVQSAYYFKNENKKNNNLFIKKKYKIKDENVMKQLESINFFGPYFSYCPQCGNRNVDFYKNLDNDKLIQIVQQIKKIRGIGSYEKLNDTTKKKKNNANL